MDLGGTWVRVSTATAPAPRRSFKGPTPGLAGLPALLDRLWRRWRLSPSEIAVLGVASRGIWTRAERREQARRLRRFARRVIVTSDVEAAYAAALGAAPGILLLAGTGSIALGRDGGGRWARAGGLGPLVGDEGSAFWIGREWMRAGGREDGPSRLRRIARSPDAVTRIAALAPSVLRRARRGHAGARRIVQAAQVALAELVVDIARRLGLPAPVAVSWAGGLLQDAPFRRGVWRRVRRRGVTIEPVAPHAPAATPAARRDLF